MEQTKTKKKQKVSVSYTLKAFGKNIEKLKEMGLIDAKQDVELKKIKENVIENYIKKEFT